jgi:cysteine desulfuration protein SufE
MDPTDKTEGNLVKGCQSQLWFNLTQKNGRYSLQMDSDSMLIKGIGALLVRLVEGRTGDEIQSITFDFLDELEIWKLASDRNNGLKAMLGHLKQQVAEDLTAKTQRGK